MRTAASILAAAALAAALPAQLAEPWEHRYDGDDARGDHVVALWSFDGEADAATADRSGNGHTLTLAGARSIAEGRFGGALASARGWPIADERHAATAADHDALSPRGAFTIELWLRPDGELGDYGHSYLVDKKYVSDNDYQLILDAPDRSGRRRLRAVLGFGGDSETYRSRPAEYEADQWYHVAMTYDGAGALHFYRGGTPLGGATRAARGSISPGSHPLSIGDRLGSYYHGFPGQIDELRIASGVREFASIRIERLALRSCFRRMEPSPTLALKVTNLRRTPLAATTATLLLHGVPAVELAIPALATGASHELGYLFDTRLRPDRYRLRVVIDLADHPPHRAEFALTIVQRPRPHRMPVVMWGLGGIEPTRRAIPRLKSLGFTHAFGLDVDHAQIWKHGISAALPAKQLPGSYTLLDEALEHDLGVLIKLSPGRWASRDPALRRVMRDGTPRSHLNVCASQPRLQQFCTDIGTSVAQTWGAFPAFCGAMIHTEVRDTAEPCFHDHDRAAFRAHAGFDIPALVDTKRGVDWRRLREFPADRVVKADDPLLRYYRWYWRTGDGWNDLTTAVHRGLAASGRDDFWTFTDPAGRVASVYGSGGDVDVLSHWTYTCPDPIRIGMATDTLLRMAQGASRQQRVMKMTQLIWYRSQTAPAPDPTATKSPAASPTTPRRPAAPPATWEDRDPDAAYLTCSPMQLREAFWAKVARPIAGVMYHGWGALVPTGDDTAYRLTHPETARELQRPGADRGRAARADPTAGRDRTQRRRIPRELRVAGLRRPRLVRLGNTLVGRFVPRRDVRRLAARNRLRRDHCPRGPAWLPSAVHDCLRRLDPRRRRARQGVPAQWWPGCRRRQAGSHRARHHAAPQQANRTRRPRQRPPTAHRRDAPKTTRRPLPTLSRVVQPRGRELPSALPGHRLPVPDQ